MGRQIKLRIEFSFEGEPFCFEDYPTPKGMTREEAEVWAKNQVGGKLQTGWEWKLRVIEFGGEEGTLPSSE